MPAVKGQSSGPIPKRSDQVRRRNEPRFPIRKSFAADGVKVPRADQKWHPIAKAWYQSLHKSGQAIYYEPSDWATAVLIAESISRDLKPQFVGVNEASGEVIYEAIPMKGASLAAYLKAMSALMTTEGERRRARVELERAKVTADADEDEAVDQINEYRRRLSA